MNTLISKLLGTAVGVKIGNNTIIGLLVGVAWDENLQISELSLSPSENQVCPYKDLGSAKDYIIILLFLNHR